MTQLQISLSESANRFIEEQVAAGRFRSPGDVVADLVEKARVQAAKEKLADLILEGENSGDGVEFTRESWNQATKEKLAALVREALECEGEEIEFTEEWFERRMDEVKTQFERERST